MILTKDEALCCLADLAWWIKGYLVRVDTENTMGFGPEHIEAIRMAREELAKKGGAA